MTIESEKKHASEIVKSLIDEYVDDWAVMSRILSKAYTQVRSKIKEKK